MQPAGSERLHLGSALSSDNGLPYTLVASRRNCADGKKEA